jgi:hypothetical protein
MDYSNTQQVHRKAMILAQDAYVSLIKGDEATAFQLYEEAFLLEREAALSLFSDEAKEPTRSVLFRSAATLAMKCKKFREAEKMAALGLAGNPPEEIANELRDLYEDINFFRHLELKETELDSTEFLLSFSGNEVGFGKINSREFLNRYEAIEKLTYRTAERKLNVTYRSGSKVADNIKHLFEPFFSVPKAASFAVVIKLGKQTNQTELFENKNIQEEVIDEIIDCVQLINKADYVGLRAKINNENYYENFVSLTKVLAPDGDRIKQTGFTIIRNGEQKAVSLQRKQESFKEEISKIKALKNDNESQNESELITIKGVLKVANAKSNQNIIEIVTLKGDVPFKHKIKVSEGLSDVVKMYFEEVVEVVLLKKDAKTYELQGIDKV